MSQNPVYCRHPVRLACACSLEQRSWAAPCLTHTTPGRTGPALARPLLPWSSLSASPATLSAFLCSPPSQGRLLLGWNRPLTLFLGLTHTHLTASSCLAPRPCAPGGPGGATSSQRLCPLVVSFSTYYKERWLQAQQAHPSRRKKLHFHNIIPDFFFLLRWAKMCCMKNKLDAKALAHNWANGCAGQL